MIQSMGLPAEKHRCTVEEYLHLERDALERHEFHDGEVLSMAGGAYFHSLINANVGGEVRNALRGKPCRVLDSNLKVGIASTRSFVYPDTTILCGTPRFDPRDPSGQTVSNPRVVIEVLSPTTEAYDRGEKFNRYRELESFEEYILVSQSRPSIETFYRQPDGTWLFTPYSGLEAIAKIRSVGVDLLLSEVYGGVDFAAAQSHDTQTA